MDFLGVGRNRPSYLGAPRNDLFPNRRSVDPSGNPPICMRRDMLARDLYLVTQIFLETKKQLYLLFQWEK